ncbi:hypothetical protein MKS88_001808 [Plasmodium brasilianum]|uniref:Uncharacterized protein n=2 Tax=Plasmodium (Plasmodium) TaxID=418103 RepID=A0A1A8WZT3_PLAMA|nr:uncharacterized protein PMUG01_07013700 [Plasmodium malariae]KAI4839263.1 hypothetical protein MKS88_001808 [Plasmodium brasilianum]SBS97412.1 hypothetical protein PMALA_060170 [Plasmodium malariae]SBT87676.1 hypothetical protein PMUG01_07013700 [Plasmodium malariae]
MERGREHNGFSSVNFIPYYNNGDGPHVFQNVRNNCSALPDEDEELTESSVEESGGEEIEGRSEDSEYESESEDGTYPKAFYSGNDIPPAVVPWTRVSNSLDLIFVPPTYKGVNQSAGSKFVPPTYQGVNQSAGSKFVPPTYQGDSQIYDKYSQATQESYPNISRENEKRVRKKTNIGSLERDMTSISLKNTVENAKNDTNSPCDRTATQNFESAVTHGVSRAIPDD